MREDTKSLERKQKYLEKRLAKLGVASKFSSAKWDYWQTLLSRGDETLTELLINVYYSGGKIGAYKTIAKEFAINERAVQGFNLEDSLPWDIVKNYPAKNLLINEFNRLNKYSNR